MITQSLALSLYAFVLLFIPSNIFFLRLHRKDENLSLRAAKRGELEEKKSYHCVLLSFLITFKLKGTRVKKLNSIITRETLAAVCLED